MRSTPVGTTIFRNIQALDKDAGVNGLVEYFIVEGSTNTTEDEKMTIADGYGTFAISFPHQGQSDAEMLVGYDMHYDFLKYSVQVLIPLGLVLKGFSRFDKVTVVKTLDYEKIQRYYLTIVASVSQNIHQTKNSQTRTRRHKRMRLKSNTRYHAKMANNEDFLSHHYFESSFESFLPKVLLNTSTQWTHTVFLTKFLAYRNS
uniref:Cadherin domain-containing protein n=1 Tax=Glossina brevipalpis TaxID=37001 RepID=A0A1A9X190_9MUSC